MWGGWTIMTAWLEIHRLRKSASFAVSLAGVLVQHSHTVNTFQPLFRNAILFLTSLNFVLPRFSLQNAEFDAGLTLP